MNELIFILQILVLVGALFWAARIGKEALIALCVLLSILANFFVLKQMDLFGWNVTCSDAFAIAGIFGLNMLTQAYGREIAKKTIWISFFGLLFFAAVSQIHLLYQPNVYDESQAHFSFLLTSAPRLLIASLLTFLVVQQFDVRLYGFFQKKFSGLSWQARSTVCLLTSQILDTVLFSLLGLYGIIQELTAMMVVSYLVKCAVIALTSLAASFFNPLKKLTEAP
jgi:queuosine precursor transporter